MDLRVLIRNQREWSNIAGPVAGLTMLLENSDDLVVERYLALRASLDCANGKDQCKQEKSSNTHNRTAYCTITLRMQALSVFLFLLMSGPAQPASVPAGTRVEARLESPVQTAKSNAGDTIVAVVAGPVRAAGNIIVPQGSRLNGRVETIEPATQTSEGRVRLVFREIQFPNGCRVSTWITTSFSASPPKGKFRYLVYMGIGAVAGGVIGGTSARVSGIIGGTLIGFIIGSNAGNGKLPDLALKPGQMLHLQFGEDLQL